MARVLVGEDREGCVFQTSAQNSDMHCFCVVDSVLHIYLMFPFTLQDTQEDGISTASPAVGVEPRD